MTIRDIENGSDFPYFNSEKERLRYMKDNYSHMTVGESFAKYFKLKNSPGVNSGIDVAVDEISVGSIIKVTVESIHDGVISATYSACKGDIVVSDNLLSHENHFKHYLVDHDNQVEVMVKGIKDNLVVVSIKDACYRRWEEDIDDAIRTHKAIQVHIDKLFKSGYICSTLVYTLYDMFGVEKYEQAFIPGSLIVANIERDFTRWVGQDVIAVPQSATTFKEETNSKPTRSIICSRKEALQQQANVNMYNIFQTSKLADKFNSDNYGVFSGEVSGKINTDRKIGIFVELEDKYITGLYTCDLETYNKYQIGDKVEVKITQFEKKDNVKDEFVIKDNKIIKCNIRPVFEII